MNLASLVRAVGLRPALSVAIGVLCGMPSGAKSQTTRSCVVAQTPGAQDPVCTTAPRVMTSAAFERSISFPPLLASANVEGRVDAELAVSDSGRVDERSFRVLSTTHDIFSSAVKAGLRDWRFQAATLDGRAVRATMRIEVAFGLPHSDSMPMEETLTAVASQPGVTRVQIVWRQPPFAPPASVDSAHLYDLVAQIVAERTSKTRDAMGRARCLDWSPTGRGDAPATLITRLRELGVPRFADVTVFTDVRERVRATRTRSAGGCGDLRARWIRTFSQSPTFARGLRVSSSIQCAPHPARPELSNIVRRDGAIRDVHGRCGAAIRGLTSLEFRGSAATLTAPNRRPAQHRAEPTTRARSGEPARASAPHRNSSSDS